MSMLRINRDTLQKLNHESVEIRLRTLEQISNKLERALALKEKVDVKSVDLCKYLIRWFGIEPFRNALQVLQTLQRLLQSPEYVEEIISKMGAERLRKELKKIKVLMEKQDKELKVIQEMMELLKVYELSSRAKHSDPDDIEEMIQSASRLKLNSEREDQNEVYSDEDYEVAWSKTSTSDYTSMKLMTDILADKDAPVQELQSILLHMQLTMKDYPAEHLLQAPHIFRNLLAVFRGEIQSENAPLDIRAETLLEFINVLKNRLEFRKKSLYFPFSTQIKDLSKSQLPSQLKVTKALRDILTACVQHLEINIHQMESSFFIWVILNKTLKIYKFIDYPVDSLVIQKLIKIVARLGSKICDTEQQTRLRLSQMQFIFVLQDIVLSNPNSCDCNELYDILFKDYPAKSLYPQRFQQLQEILWKTDTKYKEKYQAIESFTNSLQLAIRILNDPQISPKEMIDKGPEIVLIVDLLQSKTLLDILFATLSQAIPLYVSSKELRLQAIDLIIKLMNVQFKPLRIYAHEKFISFFKQHFGRLMNGESYIKECSNEKLLEVQILGLPLNTTLLLNIVHSSFEVSEESIQNISIKILELLMKSPNLLEKQWKHFLKIISPVLTLMNCCTFSTKIIDSLMKLYHPDSKYLPFINKLQGTIAFLYDPQIERRSEALTRLVYTINALKGSEKYMPNLMHISDTLPNDLCLLEAPREYHHVFSDRSPARADAVATLNNLFHLLESPDVEPLIRKTTLVQINVLCENWHMTGELCNAGAYYLILMTLENALQNENCMYYPDSVIPAISILNKILLYDASVRCELSETPNIYMLLLRSLMMFIHDIQIRQDASMCLFQLIFAHQLIATERQIEGPLILGNLKIPLNIKLRAAIPSNDEGMENRIKINAVFPSSTEENQYWRFVIAEAEFKSLNSVTPKVCNANQKELDIREDFKLTCNDFKIIRATQPGVSLKRLINAASNATDHKTMIRVCSMLQQQLLIPLMPHTYIIHSEMSKNLAGILNKYLHLQPSNTQDLELFEALLDLSQTCLNIPLTPVVQSFISSIHKDKDHAFLTMLTQKEEIPLIIYRKISTLMQHLISKFKNDFLITLKITECAAFFCGLFDVFMEKCFQLFDQRDLQRTRCILSVITAITDYNLDMPDKLLLYYCRRFLQLSLALKSFSQTGSQWHRYCLVSILQLRGQMSDGNCEFRLTPGIVKYLSGLCGHTDAEIRVLVWSILYLVSQTKARKNGESKEISGAEMLLNELSYLPGGFMACCLSTHLDNEEIVWIRQLAGQLFAQLISTQREEEKLENLLEQHYFVRLSGEALNSHVWILSDQIPNDLDPSQCQIINCELISSFTQICIEMSRKSLKFLTELCTRSFMFKLYEVYKYPVPLEVSQSYYYINMVCDISRLYTMCYVDNLVFLQRTICRDPIWLDSFCKILFQSVAPTHNSRHIIAKSQLLMVLTKDKMALDYLSTKLLEYSGDIVMLYQYVLGVCHYSSSVQKCLLSVLSLLCLKAQHHEEGDEVSKKIVMLLDFQNILIENNVQTKEESENKENVSKNGKKKNDCQKNTKEKATECTSSISEHLCIALMRLFTHLYSNKICKFTTNPTENQQQVIETLALLLKVSPAAQTTAHDVKLDEQIFNIFKHFFEEFATMSCTTYVKRHGEIKKQIVVRNLHLIFNFLLTWHSSPSMKITDEVFALEYTKIIIQIWPWLAHSAELKLTVLKVCAFLCERSIVMCKRFSSINNTPFSHSVLQLTIKLTMAETTKVKATSSSDYFEDIFFGLRTLINCCSCAEGRLALTKAHVIDIYDSLYPFNPKQSRLKPDILNAWLEFWEIFSRYEEGALAHHLNALCSVINRSKGQTRLLSLRILRNMTFLNSNRNMLLNSSDFLYTINEIITQPLDPLPDTWEEQLIVSVAIWQLISGGVKYSAMIRGTKMAKNLRLLKDFLKSSIEEDNTNIQFGEELLNVLNVIFQIFEH